MNSAGKYAAFPGIELTDRKWPSRTITKAPLWCSVDLRDGNQALVVPMTVAQKLTMFRVLVDCGFKEIEIGFPSASGTEFEFARRLIGEGLIPDDVTIQVLVQAREELIARTVESLVGARRAIIHLYNSTSPAQRRIVFGLEKSDILKMAVQGTRWVAEYAAAKLAKTEVVLQYSPESFSATEVEFATEVVEAVMDEWRPTPERKMIVNLPDTVQVAMPNIYADQIEWVCRHLSRRNAAIISVHVHNDRGTGVAATELALLAGAERVEGTLFGNGERTGNTDLITVALNLFAQGIDPGLDFSDLGKLREAYERTTGMTVPPRQPYSGELVFTAFSGSHQDAIRKGLDARKKDKAVLWEVPYLPIDPADVGRVYEPLIRVNSQSGKGGIAYLLERGFGIRLPKPMQPEFGAIAGKQIDARGGEVTAADLKAMLWNEYVERDGSYMFVTFHSIDDDEGCSCDSIVAKGAKRLRLTGMGNGPIDAFVHSLKDAGEIDVTVLDQSEHALGKGSDASAIAYIRLGFADGKTRWGIGVDTDTLRASIRAVISALNRQ
jgi:2-isopropylmalate synthase